MDDRDAPRGQFSAEVPRCRPTSRVSGSPRRRTAPLAQAPVISHRKPQGEEAGRHRWPTQRLPWCLLEPPCKGDPTSQALRIKTGLEVFSELIKENTDNHLRWYRRSCFLPPSLNQALLQKAYVHTTENYTYRCVLSNTSWWQLCYLEGVVLGCFNTSTSLVQSCCH